MKRNWRWFLVCGLVSVVVTGLSEEAPQASFESTLDSFVDPNAERLTEKLDMSLAQAISLGLKYSPMIRSRLLDLEGSDANRESTLSNFRTQYDLGGDLRAAHADTRLPKSSIAGGLDKDPTTDSQSASVSPVMSRRFQNGVEMALSGQTEVLRDGNRRLGDDGDRHDDLVSRYQVDLSVPLDKQTRQDIYNLLRSSEIGYERTEGQLYLEEKNLVQTITNAYWDVVLQEQYVVIQRDQVEQSRRNHELIQIQNQYGMKADFELTEAEIRLSNDESDLVRLEGQLANAYENFNNALGIPIPTVIQLTEELSTETVPYDRETCVKMVLEHSVELRNLRLTIEQSENALQLEGMGRNPDVSLNSSFAHDDDGSRDASVFLSFSWPVGDGGRTKARVRAAQADLEGNRILLWNTERRLIREVYQEIRDIDLQTLQIKSFETNRERAARNLDVARLQYENGDITFRRLLDNQGDLQNAEQSLVRAKVLYNASVSSLMNKIHDSYLDWTSARTDG